MIAFTLDLADMIMAATLAAGVAAIAYMHHRDAVEAAVKSKAVAAGKLAKSLKAARIEIAALSERVAIIPDLQVELARARRVINSHAVESAALAASNERLEIEVQDYARASAEMMEDLSFSIDAIDSNDPILLARSMDEQFLRRDMLERITVAHIFDCVQHARGPLMPWAKALRLGPYKSASPMPVLEQASAILEAEGVFEQLKEPRSILRDHFESKQAQAEEAKAGLGKRGGGKR